MAESPPMNQYIRNGVNKIEKKSSGCEKALNTAKIAHGTAKMVRGAFTGDMISVAHGAVEALSPKVIAIILSLFLITDYILI
ncbi:MAG: hypothetical protein EOM19_05505 [Candidatus Moranbacteria bacterium]|nr:hypothetical protein [Candidatus Moranbacteria bacterium]